jgi:L-alanine-DL-glutamate epimerase-like enolase superfamily enzyme
MSKRLRLLKREINLSLCEVFVSPKGPASSVLQFVLRANAKGVTGFGAAVPASEYGGSPLAVARALERCIKLLEDVDFDCACIGEILASCETQIHGQWAALAAVDMALHDLAGQIAELPVHRMLGLATERLQPTGFSIGLMSEAQRLERVRQVANWPIVKLKIRPGDIAIVRQVREFYSGRIWVDGNGSWTVKDAIAALEELHRCSVELWEQPVRAGALHELRSVRERSTLPIIADEDCVRPEDLHKLEGCVDGINIKLLKCGGIKPALQMILLAREMGLKVMLGCKTESVLGITATAQLGSLADFIDLDGHMKLVDDPFTGLSIDSGRLLVPSRPGLGVQINRDILS